VALAVVVAIVNAAIVTILACARFFYASGRDRTLGRPLDAFLAAIHPRFESPWAATLLIGAVGMACCFVDLTFLLVLSGAGLVVTYAAISLAAIVGRRTGVTAHGSYRMPLFPLAPIVALLALGYVAWTSWLDPAEGRPGLIATGVQMAAAAGYYWLVVRRRGVWRTQGRD
jgi:amino acid transporter